MTIVREFSCPSAIAATHGQLKLTVVEISLEDDQVGLGQVLEEIGCLRVQVPEGVSSAPEGVGLVPPLALLLVLLPSVSKGSKRIPLGLGSVFKELTVDTRVEDPIPVPLGDIGNEPRDLLSVEDDLRAGSRLDEPIGVDQITIKLET